MVEKIQCKVIVGDVIDKYTFKNSNELYEAINVGRIAFENNLSKVLYEYDNDKEFMLTMSDIVEKAILNNKNKYPSIKDKEKVNYKEEVDYCKVLVDELINLYKMNERGYNEKFISLFKKELYSDIEDYFECDDDIIYQIEKIKKLDNDTVDEDNDYLLHLPNIVDIDFDLPFDIDDTFKVTLENYLEDISEKGSSFNKCIYCDTPVDDDYVILNKEDYKYDDGEDFKFCDIDCLIQYLKDLNYSDILK